MHRISDQQRRARLGDRQFLARPGTDVETVAEGLLGLHSSDPATVYLAAWARLQDFEVHDLEDALYEHRRLVRVLGMRRTLFVTSIELAATIDAACTRATAPAERRRLVRILGAQGVSKDPARWLTRVERATLEALGSRGEATAVELTEDVPQLGKKIRFGEGKSWGGTFGLSTRVLFLLAAEGRILRGRPLGTWLSSQYRWAPTTAWLGTELPERDPARARADLARRWLATFGPGTRTDLRWWTGWTVSQVREALAVSEAVEVRLDCGTGFALPDDLAPTGSLGPWVALVPSLDSTVMGWKERTWYLGDHQAILFDRNGNAGPTVWADGRIVGGWAQRSDGGIAVELLEDVGAEHRARIDGEAGRLADWLGDVRLKPRFRTPLEKRLTA